MSNFHIEALGESRQRVDLRLDPKLLNAIHARLARDKERARREGLPEPTLTFLVSQLLSYGLEVADNAELTRAKNIQDLERFRRNNNQRARYQ